MELRRKARNTREVNGAYVGHGEESYGGRGRDAMARSPENLAAVLGESRKEKKNANRLIGWGGRAVPHALFLQHRSGIK